MKFYFKKQLSLVAVFALMLTLCVAPAFAANDYFVGIAADVGYVYDYVDNAKDNLAINKAKSNLIGLTADSVSEEVVADLMTESFLAKFENDKDAAKAAIVNMLAKSLSVYFSSDEDALANALEDADAAIADSFTTGLGMTSTNQWFDMFLRTKADSEELSRKEGINGVWRVWALGSKSGNTDSLTDLYKTMDDLLVLAMNERLSTEDYIDLADAFDAVDWTAANIVKASRNILKIADKNNVAEFAMIKAAARSVALLEGLEAWIPNGLVCSGNIIGGEDDINTVRFTPATAENLVLSLDVMDYTVTNLVGYSTTNSDLVDFETKEQGRKIIAKIDNTKKGTADIILKRDPLGNNAGSDNDWIVRFRVVVANEIAPADNYALTGSELTWDAVDNAVKYVVAVKKDGVTIDTVTVTDAKIDFADYTDEYGNGTYTADVTAYGDIPEEVGETSSSSVSYAYSSALATVGKPAWSEKAITWVGVDGAETYEVVLYKTGVSQPFSVESVPAEDGKTNYSFDFAGALEGETGTFYATVQAKSADKLGGVSEVSDGLFVQVTYNVTGNVKLESIDENGAAVVREDNSGITVKLIAKDREYEATTVANGDYTFENIADGKYDMWFSYTYYLTAKKANVEVKNGELLVDDIVLLFGNFASSGSGIEINHLDLSVIIGCFGATTGANIYDANMDINGDGRILLADYQAVMKNYGKTAESY